MTIQAFAPTTRSQIPTAAPISGGWFAPQPAGGRFSSAGGAGAPDGALAVPAAAVAGAGGAPAALARMLVDALLRSKGGRPLAVRHLEDAAALLSADAPAAPAAAAAAPATAAAARAAAAALRLEILGLMRAAAAGAPPDAAPAASLNSLPPPPPPLASPRLAGFYVEYHFLHFARLYHHAAAALAAPASSRGGGGSRGGRGDGARAALRAARAHLEALAALAAAAPAAGGARRRFLRLHALEFLTRELSLEHGARHQALLSGRAAAASAAASSLGTPAGSARVAQLTRRSGGALDEQQQQQQQGLSGRLTSSRSRLSVTVAPVVSPQRAAAVVAVPAAAAAEPIAGFGSPLVPRPPEGPPPSASGSPPRRRPAAVPALTLPTLAAPPPPIQPAAAASPRVALSERSSSNTGFDGDGGDSPTAMLAPPDPTGDLSDDLAAIEEWEARTGRVYNFRGLTDSEGAESEHADAPAPASPSPAASPAAPAAPRAAGVPRLQLTAGAAPGLTPPPLGGWAAAGGALSGGSDDGGESARGAASDGGSSYRPGYDLEEDLARGYCPPGVEGRSDYGAGSDGGGGGSDGSTGADDFDGGSEGGLIAAGYGSDGGGAAPPRADWGSSCSASEGSGGEEDAPPAGRRLAVPALNLAAKATPLSGRQQQQQQQATAAKPPLSPLQTSAWSPPHAHAQQQQQQQQQQEQQQKASTAPSVDHQQQQPGSAGAADPLLASYRARRAARPLYRDDALHAAALRLAAALLLAPDGRLDPLALPRDTTDNALQRHALVLRDHLSHPDNARALARLWAEATTAARAGGGVAIGGGAGLRRLLKLSAPALFDAARFPLERGGQLASGAYGSASAARVLDARLPRPLAAVVKAVTVNADASHHDAANFERAFAEAAALEALRARRGVAPLLDFGLAPGGGAYLFAFPRYAGTLAGWRAARAGRPLDARAAALYLSMFLRLVRTVARVHAAGVVHFDLKGANFLTAPRARAVEIAEALAALGLAPPEGDEEAGAGARGAKGVAKGAGADGSRRVAGAAAVVGAEGGAAAAAAVGRVSVREVARAWPPRPPADEAPAPGGAGSRRPGRPAPASPEKRRLVVAAAAQGGGGGGAGAPADADAADDEEDDDGDDEAPYEIVLADFGEAAVLGAPSGDDAAALLAAPADAGAAAAAAAAAANAAPQFASARHRGTPAFMSPEMHMLGSGAHARGHAGFDRRRLRGAGAPHDVWGLGCCLYELLAGAPPFAGEPDPALHVCAALEADARARAAARRGGGGGGAAHRQASVLRAEDRRRLAEQVPPELAPVLAPEAPAAAAAVAAATAVAPPPPPGAAPGAGWLQQQRQRRLVGAPPPAPAPASAPRPPPPQQQHGSFAGFDGGGPQYGGLAGALLALIDSILVLDATQRPGLAEVERSAARLLAAVEAGAFGPVGR